jgi:hypothetical protein
VMHQAVCQVHTGAIPAPWGQYSDVTVYNVPPGNESRGIDKVKVARSVAERDPDLSVLDLRDRVNELVGFIQMANYLSDGQLDGPCSTA